MLVRVWNDNVHPFRQDLNGVVYKIPAKDCLEMDEEEADRLLKAFSPIKVDYDGNPLPISYKMLRVDEEDVKKNRQKRENKTKTGNYVCQACGYVAANKWELNGHSMDQHRDTFEDREEAEAAIASEEVNTKKRKGR